VQAAAPLQVLMGMRLEEGLRCRLAGGTWRDATGRIEVIDGGDQVRGAMEGPGEAGVLLDFIG
jgi:hypothetical protein